MASPKMGSRRNVRPLRPLHFSDRAHTRQPGDCGWSRSVICVVAREGICGALSSVKVSDGGSEEAVVLSLGVCGVLLTLRRLAAAGRGSFAGESEFSGVFAGTSLSWVSTRLLRTSSFRQERKML